MTVPEHMTNEDYYEAEQLKMHWRRQGSPSQPWQLREELADGILGSYPFNPTTEALEVVDTILASPDMLAIKACLREMTEAAASKLVSRVDAHQLLEACGLSQEAIEWVMS